MMAGDLREIAGSYRTAKRTVDDPVRIGPMSMDIKDDGRLKKVYAPTEKGTGVASRPIRAKQGFEDHAKEADPDV